MAKKSIKRWGRKALSLLLTITMVTSLLQISAFAQGTAADPYDIGDVVTVEGTSAPTGEKAANSEWHQTGSADAVYAAEATCDIEEHAGHGEACYEFTCQKEEYTHSELGSGCRPLTCTTEEHSHGSECCTKREHRHNGNCYSGGGKGKPPQLTCTTEEHFHGYGRCSYCSKGEHTHSEICYASCAKEEHTHSELGGVCYTLTCEKAIHAHTNGDCYALVSPATTTWTLQAVAVSVASRYNHIHIKTDAAATQTGKVVTEVKDVTITEPGGSPKSITMQSGDSEWTSMGSSLTHNATVDFSAKIDGKWYSISLDKYDTYPDNTYYNGDRASKLGTYFGISEVEGKGYDISGKSVFLVSAIVCNGSGVKLGGFNKTDGLDLVLNIETILQNATNVINASKTLRGATLTAEQFSFQLIDSAGNVLQTKTNAADGSIAFDPITYSSAGTYTYTVKEVTGSAKGYTYDNSVYTVTVVVAANSASGAYQVTSTTITKGGASVSEIEFENSYAESAPILGITKEADKSSAMAGETINYTITVTNTGSADASGVTVTDTHDVNLSLAEDADLQGGSYNAETRTITWTGISVAQNDSWSVTIPMVLAAVEGGEAVNTAAIGGGDDDKETVTILGSLEITKVANAAVPADASFTITGPDSYSKTVKYSEFTNGKYVLKDLVPGEYTVTEDADSAKKDLYTLEITGNGGKATVSVTEAGQVTITNTYTEIYVPQHTKGSVTVTKVSNGADTPDTATFQLQKLNGSVWENVGGTIAYSAFTNGAYTFSNLEEGTYRVVESGAGVTGFELDTINAQTAILTKTTAANGDTDVSDGSITITNNYDPEYVPTHTLGSIVVTKVSDGADTPDTASFQLQKLVEGQWVNHGLPVSYSSFVGGSYTINFLAEGTYRIVESGAGVTGFDLDTTNTQTAVLTKTTAANGDTDVNDGAIAIINVYTEQYVPTQTKGSIVVSKVSNGADTPATASFQLQKLDGGNWVNVGAAVAYSAFTNGAYTFSNLEEGTYRVAESGAGVTGFELFTSNPGSVELTKATAANGDETISSGVITIINNYSVPYEPVHTKGFITLTKISTGAATPDTASFQLQKLDGENWVNVGAAVAYSAFTSGAYTFTELEEGTYRVVESGAGVADFDLDTTNTQTAVLTKSTSERGDTSVSSGSIRITNAYKQMVGGLKIQKITTGNTTPADAVFTITGPHNYSKAVKYSEFTDVDGVFYYEIANLPIGSYTVTESGADVEDYDLNVVNNGATAVVVMNKVADVVITNGYTETYVPQPLLDVTKVADRSTAKAGDTITYTITVTNTGDAAAKNLVIVDTPDKNLTIVETGNGVYDQAKGTITWNVSELLPIRGTWTGTVKATVKSTSATEAVNTVTVTDGDGNTDTDTETVTLKGTLTISKRISGLDSATERQLANVLSFTITDPNGVSRTYDYKDMYNGTVVLENLTPGIYTIVENNAEVGDGYILDNGLAEGETGWQVEVKEGGRAVTLNINNNYISKIYNIWFDAGNHGDVNAAGDSNFSGVWRNRWMEFVVDEDNQYNDWSGFALRAGDGVYDNVYTNLADNHEIEEGTSVVLYHFSWAQWLEYKNRMGFNKPGLTIEEGWESDTQYYLDGGETAFSGIEAAVEYMNANPDTTVDANGFYNAYYVARYKNDPVPPTTPTTPDGPSGGGNITPPEDDYPIDIQDDDVPLTELPDEDVPLTELPDEEVPLEEIPEEEVPLAEAPETGDTTALYAILALVSGIGLAYLTISGKKREEDAV